MSAVGPSPRQLWLDAVWECQALRPNAKLVANAFAKYAYHGLDDVWLAWSEARRITGLSNDGLSRAVKQLRDNGWIAKTTDAAGPQAARYMLRTPSSTPRDGVTPGDGVPKHSEVTPISGSSTPISGRQHSARQSRTTRTTSINREPQTHMSEFEEFWNAYGRKEGKKKAREAYEVARESVGAELLLSAAIDHRSWHEAEGTEPRWFPLAVSWLEGERWDDERTSSLSVWGEPRCAECNRTRAGCIQAQTLIAPEDRHEFDAEGSVWDGVEGA